MIELSASANSMRSSEIRRLMALSADPSIISFAGGMPANSLLPIDTVDELLRGLSGEEKRIAMQYGPTTGYPPLVESLKQYLRAKGLPVDDQGILITTGAQQAINLLCKVLLDPGDLVVTENPTFIGALAAFLSYLAHLVAAPLDDEGIVISELRNIFEERAAQVKLVYVNPSFQNPSGVLYSESRKKALLDALKGHRCCLLEDDPYGELYFDEKDKPGTLPIKAMGFEPVPICYAGSFAKIFGPGLRLGWLLGPREIIEKCELAKQSMDACSPSFSQVLAHAYLSKGKLPGYLRMVRADYARRARTMLDALGAFMPDGVTWTRPRGGFYVWVTLPERLDSTDVFKAAIGKRAAFVIGSVFDPYGRKNNTFRLAFSHAPENSIAKGIEIIAGAVKGLL